MHCALGFKEEYCLHVNWEHPILQQQYQFLEDNNNLSVCAKTVRHMSKY